VRGEPRSRERGIRLRRFARSSDRAITRRQAGARGALGEAEVGVESGDVAGKRPADHVAMGMAVISRRCQPARSASGKVI
jgi:hypothetical protein